MIAMTMRRAFFLIAAMLFSVSFARAHSEQDAPAFVEIVPQRTFLTVRISGNGGDLSDLIHADAHGISTAQASAISEQSRQQAREYFGRHLMLKQNGVRLKGELRELRLWQSDALDSSRTRFEATLRYARDPKLASAPLRVTSGLFDYLEKSRAVVSTKGEQKTLQAGETAEFGAASATSTPAQNAGDWGMSGVLHTTSGWDYLVFILALLLAASHLPMRAVAVALGAFTLAHGLTFSLATLGVLALPLQWVAVGIAVSILVMGGHDFLLSRGANTGATSDLGKRNTILVLLAAACGLIHGFASAPTLIERGLPEEGLALCLVAFVAGTALAQAVLGVVAWRVLKSLCFKFEHGAQYGGMNWPRATQFASLFFVGLGGFWMIERLMN